MKNITAFFLLLGFCCPSLVFGYVRSTTKTNGEGAPLFWKTPIVPYYIHEESLSGLKADKDKAIEAIKLSFSTWTTPSCSCVQIQYKGMTSDTVLGYDQDNPEQNKNIILVRSQAWPHEREAVAVTSTLYNVSTGEIVAFDIEINAQNFQFIVKEESSKNNFSIDIQNALTHEVGHVLGLDHSPVRLSTMYYSTPPGETGKRELHKDDQDAICAVYKMQNGTCLGEVGSNVVLDSGCGCSSTPSNSSNALLFLCFLSLLWLKRKSKTSATLF